MGKYFRAFLLSLLDLLKGDVAYHSASLTYQFLTVIGSIIMVLAFISMYLPFLDPIKIYQHLQEIVPSYAEDILNKILPAYKKRAHGSVISFAIAYYFSLSFAKALNTAFGFMYGKKPVESEIFFWTIMPLVIILYAILLSFAVVLIAISKALLGGVYYRIAEASNLFVLFLTLAMLYSLYFKLKKATLFASALVALMLLLLNKAFSLIVVKMISLSPLYSIVGSPLLLLLWLYYSFSCLLVGVRMIARLDKPFQ
ncbi:MAG: YhjD/YihY/BrkB family envelope integrity protein [Aquificaceae bacterium]